MQLKVWKLTPRYGFVAQRRMGKTRSRGPALFETPKAHCTGKFGVMEYSYVRMMLSLTSSLVNVVRQSVNFQYPGA